MSDIMDLLGQMLLQGTPPAPPRQPAGKVTPILRTELTDATDPEYLGSLVTSAELTEADIDRTVAESLTAQAAQDELVQEGGRLIGLRVSEVRPTRPAPTAPAAPAPTPAQSVPYA